MYTVDKMMKALWEKGHGDIVSMWSAKKGNGFMVTWNLFNTATIILDIYNEDEFWSSLTHMTLAAKNSRTVDDALVDFYAQYISEWKQKHLYRRALKAENILLGLPEPKDGD